MTRAWVVIFAWVFVVAGATLGIALASDRAGAEVEPEVAADQYGPADGSEAAPAKPSASASASASAPASPSPGATASAPADAPASASASAPVSELEDDLVDGGPVGGAAPEDDWAPDGSGPPASSEASSSAPTEASAGASATAPADEEAAVAGEEDAALVGPAGASASASPNPGDDGVDSAPEETATEPPAQEATAGAPGEDAEEPPANAEVPAKDYHARPCADAATTCGLDVPPKYKCSRIYEGDQPLRPTEEPEFYSCTKYEGMSTEVYEGPDGQLCSKKLVYTSVDDTDPEVQYECHAADDSPDPSKVCGYDEDWKPLWCTNGGTFNDTGPSSEPCGEDNCGFDVPKRFECARNDEYAFRHMEFACSEGGWRHYAGAPENRKCQKAYYFRTEDSEPVIIYSCEERAMDEAPNYCGVYDENWKPIPCTPGSGDAVDNAQKPSDDAQQAIKDERKEPGGGWQSIRQFGGFVGNAALGFVGAGEGVGTGGDPPGPGGSPGRVGLGIRPEATIPEVSRVEGGRLAGVEAEPDGLPVLAAEETAEDPGGYVGGGSFGDSFGRARGSAVGPERDGGGEVAAAATDGSETEEREGVVPSTVGGGGSGDGGGTGGSSGGASGGNEAAADAGADQGAEGGDGVLSAGLEEAAGRVVGAAQGSGDWSWGAVVAAGALLVGGLTLAGMRRRGAVAAGQPGSSRRSG